MLCCCFQTVTRFRTFRPHWREPPTKRLDVIVITHGGIPTQRLSDRVAAAWSSLTKERQILMPLIKSDRPTFVVTKWRYNQIFVCRVRVVVSMVSRKLSSVSMVSLRQFTSDLRNIFCLTEKPKPRPWPMTSSDFSIFVLWTGNFFLLLKGGTQHWTRHTHARAHTGCVWGCSRWWTLPEKIRRSQSANPCGRPLFRSLHGF